MEGYLNIDTKKGIKRKTLIGLITVVLIVIMFPKGESIEHEVTEGIIWIHDDLIAPFSFPIIKDKGVYQAEVKASEESVYPVFVREESKGVDSLQSYASYMIQVIDDNLNNDDENTINPTFLSSKSFEKFLTIRKMQRNMLSRGAGLKDIFSRLASVIDNVEKTGIISIDSDKRIKDSIAIRQGNIDRIEPISNFIPFDQARRDVRNGIRNFNYNAETENAVLEFAMRFVFPNIIYDTLLTNIEIEQAKNSVSEYSGIVNENERIIAKHDRITKQAKLKIESYKEAKGDTIGRGGMLLQALGKFIHISFLIGILSLYLYYFRKKIFYDNTKIVLIAIVFIFVSFVTFLLSQLSVKAPIHFLIFVPAAAMIFTIVFDSRVGFYTTVILCLITGALRGNDYTFMTMNFIASGIAVYTVRDIKNRTQIFRSFTYILIGYFASILAFGLERFASVETMLIELAFAGSNALISPVLTYGLLIFFERIFKITTDLTLMELSNFDRPMLRDLARKAPGTFNHSLIMGNLVETAAEKIGANPLLARVGSYYHDIGKTITPLGFVENQMGNQNIHEDLKPEESVKMIIRHVKEGIDLAVEEKLPAEIVDFIPMHHGTTTITFFYEKAKELYGEGNINIDDFRYPGPKPNTRETAIVMLADGCESAVRSITEPDQQKVENMINNIINARIKEGQLDDAPITFRDITVIKNSFKNNLLGQYHKRIKYPKQEEMEKDNSAENVK
ncbi:MAG TPA: HDIG domain-containing protein [Ignavibacteriaceae bacterium]|nr:HDIG domain-containing protein [Ignavibacteriaceae bacterium]